MDNENFEAAKEAALKLCRRKIHQINKKVQNLEKAYLQGMRWEETQHIGDLLKANYQLLSKHQKQIHLEDWLQDNAVIVISLDDKKTPQENIASYYKKSKKLKLSIPHMVRELEKTKAFLAEQLLLEKHLEAAEQFSDLPVAPQSTPKKIPIEKKRTPYKIFHTENKDEIWVGRGAKDNHTLTFHLGRGDDIWMHIHNYSGSHVIIRPRIKGIIPEETIQDALQLALHFCQGGKLTEGEVIVSQIKWLRPFKGEPGKVQLSEYKVRKVLKDQTKLNRLFERYYL